MPSLNYALQATAPPRTLTLEESEGYARVLFPVAAAWTYALSIGVWFANGIGWFLMAMMTADLLRRTPSTDAITVGVVAIWGLPGCVWCLLGVNVWRRFRKFGHVPRTLIATKSGLTLSHMGWWRMRERSWPAAEIRAVQLRPLRAVLFQLMPTVTLLIHRRNGRPLTYRLSSKDPHLPARIAEKFAAILGCPVLGLA